MSIYRRHGSAYFQYDFTVAGVRFRGSTETADREQAKAIYAKLRSDAVLGKHFHKRQPISISAATERYYQEVAKHQPSADDTDRGLARLVDHFKAATLLSSITSNEITDFISKRRGQPYRGKLPSNATVNREVELLRRVMIRADDVWKLDVGEMPVWKDLLLVEAEERNRSIGQAEIAGLIAEAESLAPDLAKVIRFSLMTGVRLSGAIKLKWPQVDLAAKTVSFRIKSKKPGGETLRVPLSSAAVVLLANQAGLHPEFVFTYVTQRKGANRDRSMTWKKGQRLPFTKTGWRKTWATILKNKEITDFRWHDLRHTSATWTLRATRNIALVQKMLGHADIASTQRYAHVMDEELRDGVEAASRRIFATPESGTADKPLENQEKKAV
jgi:integrase